MNKKIIGISICILFLVSSIVPFCVASDNVTINENNIGATDTITLHPSEDSYIHQGYPNNNFGSGSTFYVCNMYGAYYWEHDALIKFDLSSIPNTVTISSASLNLYYYGYIDNNPAGRPITCYRITSTWGEMSVTWNNRPSYYSVVTSSVNVPSTFGWMSWDVKNDVIDFVSGSVTNFGWQLMDETYWGTYDIPQSCYRSREGSPKPYLEIEIVGNTPPSRPSKPSGPAIGYVGDLLSFSTSATDFDNDQIQYGWDWNGNSVVDEWSGLMPSGSTHYKSHQWDDSGTYSIKVKAKDSNGAISSWSYVKTVDILPKNQPPNTPNNPNPSNHSIDVDINTNLSWSGGDPDEGDTVTYDVYFGSMLPLPKVASNITATVFDPGTLANSLTYFWSIVAWDNHGAATVGPGWDFTTVEANRPPNKPSKPTGEINGTKGITYLYTTNAVDPDDDQVYYLWDWGDGSYSKWTGPYDSGLLANASHSWAEGSYNIRVKSKDINDLESEWSDPLVVTMPKTYIHNPIKQFLLRILVYYPFFEKILNQIII